MKIAALFAFVILIVGMVTIMVLGSVYQHFKKKYKQRQYRTYWENTLINNKETWK